jgi:putative ABC transport system substrate-binding protein
MESNPRSGFDILHCTGLGRMNRRHAVVALIALGAAAGARSSWAQQQDKVWRVGFLRLQPATAETAKNNEVFLRRMRDLGYVEGRNLILEWRYADGKFERLPELAADLVRSKVDLIVAVASAAIGAAQKSTAAIPIVMATTGDPVGSGFVKSLARPGGNITGLSNMGGDTGAKHVELLHTMVPRLSRVGVLVTPTSPTSHKIVESIQAGAQKLGVKTLLAEVSTQEEIEAAFSMMARGHAGAVVVGAAPFFTQQRSQLAELGVRYRLPSIFGNRGYVEAGGLMSYGQKIADHYLRAADYVDKILKGAKPGDLPVEQPVTLELVINLKTAKALGLKVPQSILLRADEVIQ